MPHTHLLLQSISARPQSGNDSFLIRAAWHHREPRIEHCIRVPVPTRYQFFSNSSRVCALHDFCNNLYNSNWIKLLEKFILGLGVLQLFFFFFILKLNYRLLISDIFQWKHLMLYEHSFIWVKTWHSMLLSDINQRWSGVMQLDVKQSHSYHPEVIIFK